MATSFAELCVILGRENRQGKPGAKHGRHSARDRREKDKLIERRIDEREMFHRMAKDTRQHLAKELADLHRDIASYQQMCAKGRASDARGHFEKCPRAADQCKEGARRGIAAQDVKFDISQ